MSLVRFFHILSSRGPLFVAMFMIAACAGQALDPEPRSVPVDARANPDLAELFEANRQAAGERMAERRESEEHYFALRACRDVSFKNEEKQRDWTKEEDCFLRRIDEGFAKVADERHTVAFETARFVCTELTRIHAEAKKQHWLERHTSFESSDRSFEDCYSFSVELALRALKGDVFGEGRDIAYVSEALARKCIPACLDVEYGETVAAFQRGWQPDACLRTNSTIRSNSPAALMALEIAIKRGLDPDVSELCIAQALEQKYEEAYRSAFDLCYLRHTDPRIPSEPEGPFRFAEESAVSTCVNSFGADTVNCIQKARGTNSATCRMAESTDRERLSLAKVSVAEDICQSIAPEPREALGRVDIGIEAFRLCLEEQMWRFDHGVKPHWRRDGYPSNLFKN